MREGCYAANSGHSLDQNFLPLAVKLSRKEANTCCIAAGPGQRVHQPLPDHILRNPDDRNSRRRLLYRPNSGIPAGINDVKMSFDQLRRKFRDQISARSVTAPFDREVLAHDEP
jgi:hypothetical protein